MCVLRFRIVVAVIVLPAISASMCFAQATYKGSKLCKMCHNQKHPAIVAGVDKIAHPKSMQDATKNPAAIVAVCDANSPVKKEQIKYILGAGKGAQAYIGADMKTLPAEWNVKEKKWVTTASVDAKTQCVGCHVTGYDTTKATWAEEGVTCEACHGPGSAHMTDPTKIVNPKKLTGDDKQAMVCGQCHSKGTDTTKTHAFPTTYKPGDDLAQAFIDAKPTTAGRNQQYSEWKMSKHATAGAGCVKCHEPHGVNTTQPNQLPKPVNELCLGCHAGKDMKTHAPSAAADATCATCHMRQGKHSFAKPGA